MSPSNGSSRKRIRRKALALRGRALAAPDLLIAECANILSKKVRRNELSEREAVFAAGLLAGADIEPVAMRPYLETAVRIALALDHPAYDCIYIALADAEGVRCVTADASLGRKVARQGSERYGDRVLCLADSRPVQEQTGENRRSAASPVSPLIGRFRPLLGDDSPLLARTGDGFATI